MPKMIPDTIKSEAMKLFLEGNKTAKEIAEEVSTSDVEVKPITIYAWAKKNGINKENQKIRIGKEAKAQIDEHFRRTGLTAEELVDHLMGISSIEQKTNKIRDVSHNRTTANRKRWQKQWQAGYQAFIDYKKENPDVPITAKTKFHNLNLGAWVGTQRVAKIKGKVSAERIERLEDAGFVWDQQEEAWQKYFAAFIAYKEEHGDVPMPAKAKYHDLNLGIWVNNQRTDYNKGKLSAERIERLEEAGIVWDPTEELWETGYRAFVAYKEENPNVPIPQRSKYHGLNLGTWVVTQRQDKTKGRKRLTVERIKLLEEAGIVWDAQEEAWQTHYQVFIDYQKEYPDVSIPKNTQYHGLKLGIWVVTQRVAKTLGLKRLTAKRIELLEDVGFVWQIGKGNNFPKKARITKRKVVQYCLVCGKPSKRKVHLGECYFNHYNIKLSCDACGTPFHKNRRQVEINYRVGHKNYCSPSCYHKKSA